MGKHAADGDADQPAAKRSKAEDEVLSGVSEDGLMAELHRRGLATGDVHTAIAAQVDDNYITGKELGHGASAAVYEVTHKFSKNKFAMKVVDKAGELNDDESMATELALLKGLQHPNLCGLYETFDSPTTLWLIMELVGGGDLRHAVSETEHFSESFVLNVARQVSAGLHYMHSSGVVHRDIKPENVMRVSTAPDSMVKIADFGISARLPMFDKHIFRPNESQRRKTSTSLEDVWGTPQYFAPELIDGAYGSQVDMWALGAMLYEMLTGHILFCPDLEDDIDNEVDGAEEKLYEAIKAGMPANAFSTDKWAKQISEGAQSFLQGLLAVDPGVRMGASDALKHPWLQTEAGSISEHLHGAHSKLKSRLKGMLRKGRKCVVGHAV